MNHQRRQHDLALDNTVINLCYSSRLATELGLPTDFQFEFVNDGHGFLNPMLDNRSVRSSVELINRFRDVSLKNPVTDEYGISKFCCEICSEILKTKCGLRKHMDIHKNFKAFLCTYCGHGTNRKYDLKTHTKIHTAYRPFTCKLCDVKCNFLEGLSSHYSYEHPKFKFRQYKNLKTKLQVYVCGECRYITNDRAAHNSHTCVLNNQSLA